MKQLNYKLSILLLIIPFLSFANLPFKGKYKKTKEISKSFNVSNNNTLNITNKYGNVDIVTWESNRIEIDVTITVSGNDMDKIEDKLNKINVDFKEKNNEVFAITQINKQKSKSWLSNSFFGSWTTTANVNFQIDYKVKMPIENNLHINNEYGSIIIDELNGKANITCDFGKLIIGKLNNTENKLNFDYTNHSTIEFIENATINADFSKFTVEKANHIKLNADYSSSVFEQINKLKFNCDFGNLTVLNSNYIFGDGEYTTIKIGNLIKELDIDTSFGSLRINELSKGFQKASVTADYTSVKIGIDSDASCTIISTLSFGNFRYDGDLFTFNKIKEKTTDKSYQGYFNQKGATATITTDTEFGSVKFYQK